MKTAKSLKIIDDDEGTGSEAKLGDIVHVGCACRFKNGNVLFSSDSDGLYQINLGARNAFVGLEQGSLGMRKGGRRRVKVPPNLTYYERKVYPDLSENAVLYYDIELIEIIDTWDNTLHIRSSPIYSEATKELEKRFQTLTPSTDIESEFQKVQSELFSQAEQEYRKYINTVNKERDMENPE